MFDDGELNDDGLGYEGAEYEGFEYDGEGALYEGLEYEGEGALYEGFDDEPNQLDEGLEDPPDQLDLEPPLLLDPPPLLPASIKFTETTKNNVHIIQSLMTLDFVLLLKKR